jgi:hypothetical protein
LKQNFAPGCTGVLHCGQTEASAAPQLKQNLAFAGFSVEQTEQRTKVSPFYDSAANRNRSARVGAVDAGDPVVRAVALPPWP